MRNKRVRQMIDDGWSDGTPNRPFPTVSIGGVRGEMYAVLREVRENNFNLLLANSGVESIFCKFKIDGGVRYVDCKHKGEAKH